MEKIKNPKVIYLIASLLIVIGIVVTCIWKTNFSLLYSEHTRIDVYLGKEYHLEDIKQIVKEVFPNEAAIYQEIETFHDSVAINVKQVNEEQIKVIKEKIKEKFEIEDIDSKVNYQIMPHYRLRDMIKPYIIPMIITTLIILAYVGIRYLNLGIFKVIGTIVLRMIISEAVLASLIEIVRIPVGMLTIPVAILVYFLVTTLTVVQFEKELTVKIAQEKKNK
ncbi:MAG: hypothetical protein HFJ27_03275 [Clostridia bacterium]|nr:hypothetical protein [Clostridia bacterium]